MNKIIILYTEAGGGHKRAAHALKEILTQKTSWQVSLVNPFKEISSEFDLLKKFSKHSCEDIYNKFVSKREQPLVTLVIISIFFKINIVYYYKKLIRTFASYWQKTQPDMIISVMPFINDVIAKSLKHQPLSIPFVTLITDYSECMKNVWLTSHDQLLICGSKKLVEQAAARGHPQDKIFLNSGIIVSPAFYNLSINDKKMARLEIGLNADLPIGLVMFGGYGSNAMLKIAKNMNQANYPIQFIFICGHNLNLRKKLEKMQLKYPALILGFVNSMQDYMAIADFFIGKPGGLSISEASIMKLPIIVQDNIFTLLQEKYNAQWLKQNNFGICVKNFRNIHKVVQDLLHRRDQISQSYGQTSNRAIFEVPQVLESIFKIYAPAFDLKLKSPQNQDECLEII